MFHAYDQVAVHVYWYWTQDTIEGSLGISGRGVLTLWRLLHMLLRFYPPFSGLWKICIVSTLYFSKNKEKSYFDPYFSSKLGKMYRFDPTPPFFDTCSVSSRRAVRSIPVRNLAEFPLPPRGYCIPCFIRTYVFMFWNRNWVFKLTTIDVPSDKEYLMCTSAKISL